MGNQGGGLKAQASWSLLILQPSVGFGASYGTSHVGGGAKSSLKINNQPLTPLQRTALSTLGFDVEDASIAVFSDVTGWSFRVFGGVSVNILILRLDLGIQYNLIGGNMGASLGARIQL